MPKLTLKKIAENTLRKVGRPLSTAEIWEEANHLGTVGDFVSEGKTPAATIGAYIYWSIRDNEGIFKIAEGKPRRFELMYQSQTKDAINHYLVGTAYKERSVLAQNLEEQVVSIGFCWYHNMEYLYRKSQAEIVKRLKAAGFSSTEYSAMKKFLQLKPGDRVALKSKGWPKGKKASLEIVAYATVVEREGKVYSHDPIEKTGLGHCINVEFIETDLKMDKQLGGYSLAIHEINDPNRIEQIFGAPSANTEKQVRERIRHRRRKRKATSQRRTGEERRKGAKPYVAKLRHNEIQQAYFHHLEASFPNQDVTMEEDFIDIKRETEQEVILYEVKPYAWAEDCIQEAVGQLLRYAHQTDTSKNIRLVVVGPYEPTTEEKSYIAFLKSQTNLPFDYQHFEWK